MGLAGGAYNGGFTLNAGTVIARGVDAFGANTSNVLTLNGGTVASNATRSFATTKFGGGIVVGGNVQFGELATNVSIASSTASLSFANNVSLGSSTRTLTLGNNGTQTFSGVVSNTSGGITFTANAGTDGRFDLTNTANTFTGSININGGEVRFTSNGSLGNASNSVTVDGGRLAIASSAVDLSSRLIFLGATVGTAISASGTETLTYNGVLQDKTGSAGILVKQGQGALWLGGVSTYTGNTTINQGTIQLTTGNDRLPTGTVVALGQAASANLGTLDLNGFNQTIAGLNSITGTNATASNNTVTSTGAATLTLGGSGTYSYGNGSNTNSGVITGAVSLVKSGTGTQTLGDVNTYTGSTTVSGGTLSIASTGSIAGSGVTVTGGTLNVNGQVNTSVNVSVGSTLSGAGTITGATSVSGTHDIGNSPGLQLFGDNLSYIAASLAWELEDNLATGRGSVYDGVNVTGNLDFASPSVLNLDFSTGVDWNNAFWSTDKLNTNGWLIYDVTGSTTGLGNLSLSSSLLDSNGASLASIRSGASFSLFSSGSDVYLNYVIITAVPEPSSLALVGLTVCGVVLVRRRKKC